MKGYTEKVGMRNPRVRPAIGLMQILNDDHPLVKYGSWENAPDVEQAREGFRRMGETIRNMWSQ